MTVVLLHFRNLFVPDEIVLPPAKHLLLDIVDPFTSGTQAVVLFFVLSGFVLMLPYIRGKNQKWSLFVFRRILRIYCPYLCALAVAIGGAAVWHGSHGMGHWGDSVWSRPIEFRLVLQHILLIGVYDCHQYNPAFWTLVEEMRISLIYPLLAYLVLRRSVREALFVAALLALSARGVLRLWPDLQWILTLEYIGMFLCGMVLAKNLDAVSRWYQNRSSTARILLFTSAVVLYFGSTGHRHGSLWFSTIASLGLISLSFNSPRFISFLDLRIPLCLGRISYSLYLVHIPILFGLAITMHHNFPAWIILPLYLLVSIAFASVFYVLVERPFTRLSRRVAQVKTLPVATARS